MSVRWRREAELVPPVRAFLEGRGYRVWVNPDGLDFFDVVALRDSVVGLVELKLADSGAVFQQAVNRRDWADWVAVALPGERAARALAERTTGALSRRVGIFRVGRDRVDVVREPTARAAADAGVPEEGSRRAMLLSFLHGVAQGTVPEGAIWSFAPWGTPRGRRRGRWRLDEFSAPTPPP